MWSIVSLCEGNVVHSAPVWGVCSVVPYVRGEFSVEPLFKGDVLRCAPVRGESDASSPECIYNSLTLLCFQELAYINSFLRLIESSRCLTNNVAVDSDSYQRLISEWSRPLVFNLDWVRNDPVRRISTKESILEEWILWPKLCTDFTLKRRWRPKI